MFQGWSILVSHGSKQSNFGLRVCIKNKSNTTQYTPTIRRKIWRYKHADFNRANDLLMDVDLETLIDPNDMMITNNWETVQHYKDTCYSCNVGSYHIK